MKVFCLLKNFVHPIGIIGIFIAIALPFLIYLAPNIGYKSTIQQLDLHLPLPLFAFQFIAAIILCFLLRKDFKNWFISVIPQKRICVLAIISAIIVAIFAATQIEARHRVQSDESVFLSVAQNMYHNQVSATCNQGIFKDGNLNCLATSNSFKTKGLSFLYFIGMPLFGSNMHWIFYAELLMLPLSMLLMFFAMNALTKKSLLAYLASLLMALQPTVLFQFRAMSVEPLYIFLSVLSLLIFKWACDRNTLKHWLLFALVLAFFVQTRQETAFCLLPFIIFSLPKILDKKDFKAPIFFVALSIFSVPALLTISNYQGFNFQGGEFSAHGHFFEDLAKNWEVMTLPLNSLGELINPFLSYFNYLFVIGAIYLIVLALNGCYKKEYSYLKIAAFLLLYHIQTYVILENVSGDFSIEINQRYSLVMIPSMAFIGALPLAHIVKFLADSFNYNIQSKAKYAFSITVAIAIALSFWTMHYKNDFNKNIMYNRNHLTLEEHELLTWLSTQPKKDRLFIYGRPWHFIGYGISSIHYDKARHMSSNELEKYIKDFDNEVYYIRGLDCWNSQTYHKKAVEHRIASTCDIFEQEMDLESIKNILITNSYWLQIAKFNGRKSYNSKKIMTINNIQIKTNNDTLNSSLNIDFNLNETSPAINNWTYTITVNKDILQTGKYIHSNVNVSYDITKLLPGYNSIEFIVQDSKNSKILAHIQKFFFNASTGAIPLTNIQYSSHRQEWGALHINKSIEGNTFKVNRTLYENGFGTHASSKTTFDINAKFKLFKASFGLDEESLCSDGAQLKVLGDSKIIFDSGKFNLGALHSLSLDVTNVNKLTIETYPLKSIDCDHIDIINPELIP